MAIRCKHCRKHFSWTRSRCPSCRRTNPRSLRALVIVVITTAVTCAALWVVAKAFMDREDSAAGIVKPAPEEDSVLRQIFRTPEPNRQEDPKFNR